MVSSADWTTIFETIGEDAAARDNQKVAASVDKVRQSWSRGLEQIGKAQSRINILSSALAGIGVGGLTTESFKRENLERNAIGDTITSAAELTLAGGGALIGGLIGSAVPIIGPIIGSIAGGIIGSMATAVLEPLFQRLGEAMKSFDEKVREELATARSQSEAANVGFLEFNKELRERQRIIEDDWFTFDREVTHHVGLVQRAMEESRVATNERIQELSDLIEPLIRQERTRLAGRNVGIGTAFVSDDEPNLRTSADVIFGKDGLYDQMIKDLEMRAEEISERKFEEKAGHALQRLQEESNRQLERFTGWMRRANRP